MQVNTKRNKPNKAKNNKLLILFSVLMLVVLIVLINFLLNKNRLSDMLVQLNHSNLAPTNIPSISITPTNFPERSIDASLVNTWKTYTNIKYGFQITFPTLGTDFQKIIECGNSIKEYPETYTNSNNQVVAYSHFNVDGLFQINIITIPGSLQDYINSLDNNLENEFTLEPVANANADEGIILRVNNNTSTAKTQHGDEALNGDFAPFGYTIALYRKGHTLFELNQNAQAPGLGCNIPSHISETSLPYGQNDKKLVHMIFLQYSKWDIGKSIKFL